MVNMESLDLWCFHLTCGRVVDQLYLGLLSHCYFRLCRALLPSISVSEAHVCLPFTACWNTQFPTHPSAVPYVSHYMNCLH